MRRWIRLSARLYPREWRARYGEEFDALLEDAVADWRQWVNVLRGAVRMQLRDGMRSYALVAGLMVAGTLASGVVAYHAPEYESSALLQLTPVVETGHNIPPAVLRRETEDRIASLRRDLELRAEALRTRGLSAQQYQRDWQAIREETQRRLRIIASPGGKGATVRVSLSDPDKTKAQADLEQILFAVEADNKNWDYTNAAVWKSVWAQSPPFTENLEVRHQAGPARFEGNTVMVAGGAAGLLLGLLVLCARHHRRATLRFTGLALAGCAAAACVSLLAPLRYTATLEMCLTAPRDPRHLDGSVPMISSADWARRLRKEIVLARDFREPSDANLSAKMAKVASEGSIDIRPTGSDSTFEAVVRHRDRDAARRGVMLLTAVIFSRYNQDLIADRQAPEEVQQARRQRVGEVLIVDFVTKPQNAHTRYLIMLAGTLLGILIAAVWRPATPAYSF